VSERFGQDALVGSTSAFLDEWLKDRAFSEIHIVLVTADWVDKSTSQDVGIPSADQLNLGQGNLPIGKVCMGSETSGIPICPYELSLDGLSRSPSRSENKRFEHDAWYPDRV
jgi:hypothetical protein